MLFSVSNLVVLQGICIQMRIDPARFWANLCLQNYEVNIISNLIKKLKNLESNLKMPLASIMMNVILMILVNFYIFSCNLSYSIVFKMWTSRLTLNFSQSRYNLLQRQAVTFNKDEWRSKWNYFTEISKQTNKQRKQWNYIPLLLIHLVLQVKNIIATKLNHQLNRFVASNQWC